jgi:hypothetical protein
LNNLIKPRLLILITLLLIAGCSAPADMILSTSSPNTGTAAVVPLVTAETKRIDVAFFHPVRRCALCLNLEERTKLFLQVNYTDQLQSGKITFNSYDLEDKNNAAIIKQYGALSSQLFVNTIVNGKENIQHIEKIWLPSVYNDAMAFDAYMREILSQCLETIR